MLFEWCQAKVRTAGSRGCVGGRMEVIRTSTKNGGFPESERSTLRVANQADKRDGREMPSSPGFSSMMTLQERASLRSAGQDGRSAPAAATTGISGIGEQHGHTVMGLGASELLQPVMLARAHPGALRFGAQARTSHRSGQELHRVG